MLLLNVQDAHLAQEPFALLDYTGDLYPRVLRVHTDYAAWRPVLRCAQLLPVWHFDLNQFSALLERLLWSGWCCQFTVSGSYTAQCFPLSQRVVAGFNRRDRGWFNYTGSEDLWVARRFPQLDPVVLPVESSWGIGAVPRWAAHTRRLMISRQSDLRRLHALSAEQVLLRRAWLGLSDHRTPVAAAHPSDPMHRLPGVEQLSTQEQPL